MLRSWKKELETLLLQTFDLLHSVALRDVSASVIDKKILAMNL